MKSFIKNHGEILLFLFIWIILFCCAISCDELTADIVKEPEQIFQEETKLFDVTFEGHTHQMLWYKAYVGNGVYDVEMIHWPDCKYCNGSETNNYHGIKNQYDGYTNQVIELLNTKDIQIKSAEELNNALKEYIKLMN